MLQVYSSLKGSAFHLSGLDQSSTSFGWGSWREIRLGQVAGKTCVIPRGTRVLVAVVRIVNGYDVCILLFLVVFDFW